MPTQLLTDRERAALKVVELAKALALADNHFLSAAVGRLRIVCMPLLMPMATNGTELAIDPQRICDGFVRDREAPKHDFMHSVMHCVFLHPYVGASIDRRLWNLACDIAAERVVAEVCGPRSGSRGADIQRVLSKVDTKLGKRAGAEKVYKVLKGGEWTEQVSSWEVLFAADSHLPWYPSGGGAVGPVSSDGDGVDEGSEGSSVVGSGAQTESSRRQSRGGDSDGVGKDAASENDEAGTRSSANGVGSGDGQRCGGSDKPGSGQGKGAGSGRDLAASRTHGLGLREVSRARRDVEMAGWRRVAKSLAVNLQTYARSRGQGLKGLVDDLEESSHARVDYADFLRQFAIPGEVLKVSDDEFDYVYYTYGLKLYGNLPLIEPLEYREEKRVREFVIVIDTSGSVWGGIVRRFIDATFDILKSTEAFFERVHVHIVQCDAAVQTDDVITNLQELKEWGRTMRLHGMGGTDFRPAFAYVDRLVEEGVFENLGGLVYFTDGWGTYPEWMPDYKVAFVFYDENYRKEIVPPWAAQIVLDDAAIDGSGGIR
ncbi:VWA-like domain-containing protein [Olsenella intestinalis]|uniref:VWA-like domain-containing protein n=1 Tax=Olsenella intestinalis TaxID=2930083 RepID=UPI00200CE21C|nr:VWA-like domain-containing protein [Olsenella intestinalis]